MTILVARNEGDGVWIGSDTTSFSHDLPSNWGPKWIRFSNWWIGIAGAVKFLNILEANVYGAQLEPFRHISDLVVFMSRIFQEWGVNTITTSEDNFPDIGLNALVTDGRYLYDLDSYMAWKSVGYNVTACAGSGRSEAYGADAAINKIMREMSAEERLTTILECVMLSNRSCGGNVWIKKIGAGS